MPFLLGDRAARPPVLLYGTTPMMSSSRDLAPSGLGLPPSTTALGRLRNRTLNLLSHRVLLRQSQHAANYQLNRLNSRQLPMFLLDSGALADRFIAPTVPEFDYPRSDLPTNVRYVGAVHPTPTLKFRPPAWWQTLDGDRPVVHVTQGTVDNADLSRLLEPTIEALADENVMVVATTGGRPVSDLNFAVPPNTYVAEHIPHDRAQAAGTGAAVNGLIGDGLERLFSEFQLHAVHLEQPGVLLHQRVLGLGQDLDE